MTKRCDNCKHWVESVFKGQSASGYGVWYGDCYHPKANRLRDDRHHSLYIACEKFEEGAHPNSLAAAVAEVDGGAAIDTSERRCDQGCNGCDECTDFNHNDDTLDLFGDAP